MNTTHILDSNRRKALAGAGAVAAGATLLAASLFGGSTTPAGSERRASTAADVAPTSRSFEERQLGGGTPDHGGFALGARRVRAVSTEAAPELSFAPRGTDRRSDPPRDDEQGAALQAPSTVTFVLPRYHPGTPPTVNPPSVSGSPPSVRNDDGSITVTIPTDGEVTPPSYTPGRPGRLDPPSVAVE